MRVVGGKRGGWGHQTMSLYFNLRKGKKIIIKKETHRRAKRPFAGCRSATNTLFDSGLDPTVEDTLCKDTVELLGYRLWVIWGRSMWDLMGAGCPMRTYTVLGFTSYTFVSIINYSVAVSFCVHLVLCLCVCLWGWQIPRNWSYRQNAVYMALREQPVL